MSRVKRGPWNNLAGEDWTYGPNTNPALRSAEWATYTRTQHGQQPDTWHNRDGRRVLKCNLAAAAAHQPHDWESSLLPVRCPGNGWKP